MSHYKKMMAKCYKLWEEALEAGEAEGAERYMAEYLNYHEMDKIMGDKFYDEQ